MIRQKSTLLFIFFLLMLPAYILAQDVEEKKWERKRIDAFVVTTQGGAYEGQLLAANEDFLYLWESKDKFDSNNSSKKIRVFKPEEIELIRLRRKTQIGRGAGIGVSVGLGTGTIVGAAAKPGFLGRGFNTLSGAILGGLSGVISGGILGASQRINQDMAINGENSHYQEVLGIIQKRYVLIGTPDSLNINEASPNNNPIQDAPIKGPTPSNSFDINQIHFDGGIGLNFSQSGASSIQAFENEGLSLISDDLNRLGLGLDFMINVNANLRIGLLYRRGAEQYIGGFYSNTNGDSTLAVGGEELSNQSSIRISADFVPKPINRLMGSRWEYFIGGGISLTRINVLNRFRGSGSVTDGGMVEDFFWPTEGVNSNILLPGLHLRTGIDFYLLEQLSIYGQIEGMLMPSGMVLGNKPDFSPFSNEAIGLADHKLNGSNLGILFGIRLHLAPKTFK